MNPERARDYVILLEDLDFRLPIIKLSHITKLHNDGMEFEDIAKKMKRDPYEIIIALLHQAKGNRAYLRPIAYRIKKLDPKIKKHAAAVTVQKTKREIPTVIEIEGRRYVFEPETQRK